MASHLSLVQIAGVAGPTYEEFYQEFNPDELGNIQGGTAAKFLKRSGLSDNLLSRIWDMADVNGHGFLTKQEFFVALKLIALAQNGKEPIPGNVTMLMPSPKMGSVSPALSTGSHGSGKAASGPVWAVRAEEKAKFDHIFDGLQPQGGKLGGDKVKPLLMNSKLPVEMLGKIWDLSDIDKDGFLDRDEFALAMHFVYKCLEGENVPTSLTTALIPPSKRKPVTAATTASLPRSESPAAVVATGVSATGQVEWVVTPEEKVQYDVLFVQADLDKDGFVSGMEIKDTFMKSGLPPPILARIWDLCDFKGNGLLNSEQFSLAMHLINQQISGGPHGGVELPSKPSPEMVPPSMRTAETPHELTLDDFGITRESDRVYDELEEIRRERAQVDRISAQHESELNAKTAEVQVLQRSLDRATQTVLSLETQKGEAQKKLDDYADQQSRLELALRETRERCEEERLQVETLRAQLGTQQMSVKSQEEEISRLREELNKLTRQESNIQECVQENQRRVQAIEAETKQYASQIEQAQTRMTTLESSRSELQQVIEQYSALLNGDTSATEPDVETVAKLVSQDFSVVLMDGVSDSARPAPTSVPARPQFPPAGKPTPAPARPAPPVSKPASGPVPLVSNIEDPFAKEDPFKTSLGKAEDPFSGDDPFAGEHDPFGSADPFSGDPFQAKPAKEEPPAKSAGSFTADPFEDLFTKAPANKVKASVSPSLAGADPFDAFGGSTAGATAGAFDSQAFGDGDPFGADPFAPSSSKPTRPKSPVPPRPNKSPYAPRDKSPGPKKPPPPHISPAPSSQSGGRLTPSRPQQPPSGVSAPVAADPFDPFSAAAESAPQPPAAAVGFGFADFANFDSAPSAPVRGASPAGPPPGLTEAEQILWATKESQRLARKEEKARQRENAELELAIKLSQKDDWS